MENLRTIQDCDDLIAQLRALPGTGPAIAQVEICRAQLEDQLNENYFFQTLLNHYPYGEMPADKRNCIEETVELLMQEGEKATEPGLLLGHIQCGKTDTFEKIIALSFDKGIDLVIVFTKGTNPLT